MSMEAVDVLVIDDTNAENPIQNVVVKVFDQTGTTAITETLTNSSGLASFLLDAPITYQVRFYKQLVSFQQPQYLDVHALPSSFSNSFQAIGHVIVPPEAINPRLCRCSGYFLAPNGARLPNVDIHIIAKFNPLLLEGAAVLGERVRLRTDENGYAEVDLIRFGQYEVTIQGYEDRQRCIHVPDAPGVNLPDLLFPVVSGIVLDPPGPFTFRVGEENDIVVTPTVFSSDGRELEGTAIEDVLWTMQDGSIATVFNSGSTLTLRGLQPGTTNLLANRVYKGIIRIPDTPVVGQPVGVTIDP